jgi:hypothetical protein
MEPVVEKLTRKDSAYFSIYWSRLFLLEKNNVRTKIPSEPGIFEVYRYSGGRTADLVGRSRAYYGGLRNTLRGLIDPVSPYPLNGELLPTGEQHLARYSILESSDDMDDILFFFAGRDELEDPDQEHSGRYDFVYVKEIDPEPVRDEVTPANRHQ